MCLAATHTYIITIMNFKIFSIENLKAIEYGQFVSGIANEKLTQLEIWKKKSRDRWKIEDGTEPTNKKKKERREKYKLSCE